jgi:aspartate/methionine/tyrosine aminotransferase
MVTTNPAVGRSGPNPLAALREEVARRRAAGQPLIDLSIGDPDEPTPEAVRDALRSAVGPVSNYPTGYGQAATRDAIAGFVARRHGVQVDPTTQVLPTSGSKEAIFHLPFAFIDPDGERRTVIWGSPGYPTYARGTRYAGGDAHAVVLTEADGWRLDLATLDEDVLARTCIAWLGYPHNPTGVTVDTGYLRDQLDVARVPSGDDLAYATALLEAGLVVTPGRAFGEGGEGWIRLALVPELSGCREAMDRWEAAHQQGLLPG